MSHIQSNSKPPDQIFAGCHLTPHPGTAPEISFSVWSLPSSCPHQILQADWIPPILYKLGLAPEQRCTTSPTSPAPYELGVARMLPRSMLREWQWGLPGSLLGSHMAQGRGAREDVFMRGSGLGQLPLNTAEHPSDVLKLLCLHSTLR